MPMPKKLFVYEEEDRDTTYFVANRSERECADLGEKRIVGIYRLEQTVEITAEPVVKTRD